MSPSRSVKPGVNGKVKSRRAALNRTAHALSEVRKARENREQIRRIIEQKARNFENAEEKAEKTYARFRRNIQQKARHIKKLQKEYYKLVHGAPNRAARTLSVLKKAQENHAHIKRNLEKQTINIENAEDKAEQNYARLRRNIAQKARNIEKLQKEYYKLARRAATFSNANMRSGQLNASELATLRHSANMTKAVSAGIRTLRRINNIPQNIRLKILHNIQLI
jgi:chromosome segregation ATPase